MINGASNAKGRVSCQVLLDSRRILFEVLSMQETLVTGPVLLTGMANSMSLPYFCLRKLARASVTS